MLIETVSNIATIYLHYSTSLLQEMLVVSDPQEVLDHLVLLAPLAQLDLKVQRVTEVNLEWWVAMVQLDTLVQQELQELRESKVWLLYKILFVM